MEREGQGFGKGNEKRGKIDVNLAKWAGVALPARQPAYGAPHVVSWAMPGIMVSTEKVNYTYNKKRWVCKTKQKNMMPDNTRQSQRADMTNFDQCNITFWLDIFTYLP